MLFIIILFFCMNENKYKLLSYLFKPLNDKNKMLQLKIDKNSINYITHSNIAEIISKIIKRHTDNNIIIDATAGVGGNVISFSEYFNKVYAVEIDKLRYNYLINNIGVYNLLNVYPINNDFMKIKNKLYYNIVFIDPPWGGSSYKKYKKLRLSLSSIAIEDICKNLLTINHISHIVLKLPCNYDIKHLYKKINKNKIYIHKLKNMIILVIYNNLNQ